MFSVPPTNHFAKGELHSRTRSHFRDQARACACSAQNPSGSFTLFSYSRRYSSRLLTCAPRLKSWGGGKTRFSLSNDSMSITRDLLGDHRYGLDVGMPLQLRPVLQHQGPELHR